MTVSVVAPSAETVETSSRKRGQRLVVVAIVAALFAALATLLHAENQGHRCRPIIAGLFC